MAVYTKINKKDISYINKKFENFPWKNSKMRITLNPNALEMKLIHFNLNNFLSITTVPCQNACKTSSRS